jgi:hypothetical protein
VTADVACRDEVKTISRQERRENAKNAKKTVGYQFRDIDRLWQAPGDAVDSDFGKVASEQALGAGMSRGSTMV